MTGNGLAPVHAGSINIPRFRRADTVQVFLCAAAHVEISEVLGNLPETLPEMAIAVATGKYNYAHEIGKQPWIALVYRDFLGLSPRELAVWERTTSVRGRVIVLRALAHAIRFHDIP